MARDVAEVLEFARALSRDELADLAYQVLLTLDEGDDVDEAEVAAAWQTEIRRRVDDYLSGNRNTVDVEESHAQIRASRTTRRK